MRGSSCVVGGQEDWMRYLAVDGMMSGTGVRDALEGGYLELDGIGVPEDLRTKIADWLTRYEDAHTSGYVDMRQLDDLDREGREIAAALREVFPESKIRYYSDALARYDDRGAEFRR